MLSGEAALSERVLATQAALKAAIDLHGSVGRVQAAARQVMTLGDALANPAAWDGPEAARFRQTDWPRTKPSLAAALAVLDRMRSHSETAVRAILQAGSRGQLDSPAPAISHASPQAVTSGPTPLMAFAAGALVIGGDLELGGLGLDGTIFGAPVGVVLNVAGGVVLAAAAVAGIISLFAHKQQPPQLSAQEEAAVAAHDSGQPYDAKAYKSALRKIQQGAKYQNQRNRGKQRGQPNK